MASAAWGDGLLLGIETSCDETAAAVVAQGRVVLSNVVASQVELHAPYGGVFPELASRQHVRDITPIIQRALDEAGVELAALDGIAVTRGPGLSGALLVGLNAAKGLAMATGLPLIGVNHLAGHLSSNDLHYEGRLLGAQDLASGPLPPRPPRPQLALIVSGGHTDLLWRPADAPPLRLGQTCDDAAGEAFDKAARMLGLGYPGGPAIQDAAQRGDPGRFPLPVARTRDPLDFSFSGLKTALLRRIESLEEGAAPLPVADLAAAFQDAVVRSLVGRVAVALETRLPRSIAVSGGVAANAALRAALAERFDLPVVVPPLALCTDNAAMIAGAGWLRLRAGASADPLDLDVAPSLAL